MLKFDGYFFLKFFLINDVTTYQIMANTGFLWMHYTNGWKKVVCVWDWDELNLPMRNCEKWAFNLSGGRELLTDRIEESIFIKVLMCSSTQTIQKSLFSIDIVQKY